MSQYVRANVAGAAGYIPGEQPADTTTIKLNTNENPYPPSPRVMEAIGGVTAEQLRRYPNPNARAFREAAAKVHGVSPGMIMAFNGGDEMLAVAIRACAGETDRVAFLDPSYSLYPVLTEMQGARQVVIPYEFEQEGQRWKLPAGMEKTDAKLMLIVNPNAPTGHLNPIAELDRIAGEFGGVLLVDEAYVDFSRESAIELVKKRENVLLLRSMSKGYGLAGLRFGYAIGPTELLKEIEKVRDSYPCDAISIAAATAAMEDQAYARGTWRKVVAERGRLTAALKGMGFQVGESESNFILAQVPDESKRPAKRVYEMLKERGILVRYWELPRIADKVRITIGTPEQNDRLLAELKTIV